MDEYIEREPFIKHLQKDPLFELMEQYGITHVIRSFPAADVAPVRRGRWVVSRIPGEKYICSVCGGACWYYDYQGVVAKSRYCPNCGARMVNAGW